MQFAMLLCPVHFVQIGIWVQRLNHTWVQSLWYLQVVCMPWETPNVWWSLFVMMEAVATHNLNPFITGGCKNGDL